MSRSGGNDSLESSEKRKRRKLFQIFAKHFLQRNKYCFFFLSRKESESYVTELSNLVTAANCTQSNILNLLMPMMMTMMTTTTMVIMMKKAKMVIKTMTMMIKTRL